MRLAIVLAAACGNPAARETTPSIDNHAGAPVVIPQTEISEITLSRTECMGSCPVYGVTIHRDGAVEWNGDSNVVVVGRAQAQVDRRVIDQLVVALDAIRFFERDHYGKLPPPPCGSGARCEEPIMICTDISWTTIAVRRGATTHTIEDAHCPRDPDLERLETLIDTLANTAPWTGR